MKVYSFHEIELNLKKNPEWVFHLGNLVKLFSFTSFIKSIHFVNLVAKIAENLNHHPEIIIQYNKVKLSIHTHDFAGITDLDFKFIQEVDKLKIS